MACPGRWRTSVSVLCGSIVLAGRSQRHVTSRAGLSARAAVHACLCLMRGYVSLAGQAHVAVPGEGIAKHASIYGSIFVRQGGRMSQYLEKMALGDTIDVKGPLGHFIYEGRGYYRSHGTPGFTSRMSMIAGGTGITPMFQVIKVRSTRVLRARSACVLGAAVRAARTERRQRHCCAVGGARRCSVRAHVLEPCAGNVVVSWLMSDVLGLGRFVQHRPPDRGAEEGPSGRRCCGMRGTRRSCAWCTQTRPRRTFC